MKLLVIILAVVIIALFIFGRSKKDVEIQKSQGKLEDIENHINKLMGTNNDRAFLIVEVSNSDDFIQFSGDDKRVQLDFPLVTDRQKDLEKKFRQVAKKRDLEVFDNKGSDGTRFLDIDINGSPSEVAKVIVGVMKEVFGVEKNTGIEFQLNI